jgi:hypothetical protein
MGVPSGAIPTGTPFGRRIGPRLPKRVQTIIVWRDDQGAPEVAGPGIEIGNFPKPEFVSGDAINNLKNRIDRGR